MTRVVRAAERVLRETAGWLLLVGGLAAIPLPGPGLLITFAGLMLLSRQYAWAERRVGWVRLRALEGAARSVATWPRLTVSIGGAALVLSAGIIWIASPPAPLWWPLTETWWLPGGVVVGVTQLASTAVALALLGYSYRRFRGAPGRLTAVAQASSVEPRRRGHDE
ncbi:PGPGW domain-containing protein [Nocardioides pelophilus]|uniref:PGPGW domain-containing protein n=1 Tax=Nocardioides pelophilus TaxID=2172019 RepID=UPI0016027D86|nr:PGPGW domain-containing protein [Nocardioides pelophilus]